MQGLRFLNRIGRRVPASQRVVHPARISARPIAFLRPPRVYPAPVRGFATTPSNKGSPQPALVCVAVHFVVNPVLFLFLALVPRPFTYSPPHSNFLGLNDPPGSQTDGESHSASGIFSPIVVCFSHVLIRDRYLFLVH